MIVAKTFAFVDLPKCGTTSIRVALRSLGLPKEPCNDGDWHTREIPSAYRHLPRFAVVRNPYDRALSLWNFERYQVRERGKVGDQGSPEAYWTHWGLETLDGFMLRCIGNRETEECRLYLPCALFLRPCEPVRVLHLERLQADWNAQPELPALALPHERKQTYDATLTKNQLHLIERWALEDFARYGYPLRDQQGAVAPGPGR